MTADIATTGHNGGPPLDPTPFERISDEIEKLYGEARLYLDGEPIASQGQADDISNLLRLITAAEKAADDERKRENAAFDAGKAAVQARYAPLIADTKAVRGKTVLAKEACKEALKPWLERLEAEKAAAAEKARAEAVEKARIAQGAMKASTDNLAAREAAEALVSQARHADAIASKAERSTATAGGMFGRAAGLRTHHVADITSPAAFERYASIHCQGEMAEFLTGLAQRLVAQGRRDIPGVTIREEKRVA